MQRPQGSQVVDDAHDQALPGDQPPGMRKRACYRPAPQRDQRGDTGRQDQALAQKTRHHQRRDNRGESGNDNDEEETVIAEGILKTSHYRANAIPLTHLRCLHLRQYVPIYIGIVRRHGHVAEEKPILDMFHCRTRLQEHKRAKRLDL